VPEYPEPTTGDVGREPRSRSRNANALFSREQAAYLMYPHAIGRGWVARFGQMFSIASTARDDQPQRERIAWLSDIDPTTSVLILPYRPARAATDVRLPRPAVDTPSSEIQPTCCDPGRPARCLKRLARIDNARWFVGGITSSRCCRPVCLAARLFASGSGLKCIIGTGRKNGMGRR